MLQEQQARSSLANSGFILNQTSALKRTTEPVDADAPLDDAAQAEREYVRQRLRDELQREPTEEEVDEWLRQQTEGY